MMNSIVKKVLERAAAEIAEELTLAQEIQQDVERAEKLEKMEQKCQKAEENYERLKMEFTLAARVHLSLVNEHGLRNQELVALKGAHSTLTNEHTVLSQKYVQLESAYNELVQVNKDLAQKEETACNTLGFLQQTIQTSNALHMSLLTQLTQYKQRVAQLELQVKAYEQSQLMAQAREALLRSAGGADGPK